MYRYGDIGKNYGYGLYGGVDEIVWCAETDDVFSGDFEDVDETPIGECTDDEE